MHVPDGFVSGPINAATFAVSAFVDVLATRDARRRLQDRQVPLVGVTAAFVFAAQMLNFPIAGGTSGHFLGALFAAVMLGPLTSCLILSLVLIVQCLAFGDGGITALGTNIFNMGVIGGLGGYAILAILRRAIPDTRVGFSAAVAVAAWASVVLGSLACAIELGLSGTVPLRVAMPAMVGVHALIGVGEALITTTMVSLVATVRPDLMYACATRTDSRAES